MERVSRDIEQDTGLKWERSCLWAPFNTEDGFEVKDIRRVSLLREKINFDLLETPSYKN